MFLNQNEIYYKNHKVIAISCYKRVPQKDVSCWMTSLNTTRFLQSLYNYIIIAIIRFDLISMENQLKLRTNKIHFAIISELCQVCVGNLLQSCISI